MAGVISWMGVVPVTLNVFPVLQKKARIQGISVGTRDWFEDMNRAIAQQRIHPVIDRTYSFDRAPDAFADLRKANFVGKLVIQSS